MARGLIFIYTFQVFGLKTPSLLYRSKEETSTAEGYHAKNVDTIFLGGTIYDTRDP